VIVRRAWRALDRDEAFADPLAAELRHAVVAEGLFPGLPGVVCAVQLQPAWQTSA